MSKLLVSVGDIGLIEQGFRPVIDPQAEELTAIGWAKDTGEALLIATKYFAGKMVVREIRYDRQCEFWPLGETAQRKLGSQRYLVAPVWEPIFAGNGGQY